MEPATTMELLRRAPTAMRSGESQGSMSDLHDSYPPDDPDVIAINEGQKHRSSSSSINRANDLLDDIGMIAIVVVAIIVALFAIW
jgi:hypothetical protein